MTPPAQGQALRAGARAGMEAQRQIQEIQGRKTAKDSEAERRLRTGGSEVHVSHIKKQMGNPVVIPTFCDNI